MPPVSRAVLLRKAFIMFKHMRTTSDAGCYPSDHEPKIRSANDFIEDKGME
jgi:hypothetical protein